MHIEFHKYPINRTPRWVSAGDRDDRPSSYPFPPHSLPRRAPVVTVKKIKEHLLNALTLVVAVLAICSVAIGLPVSIYLLLFARF